MKELILNDGATVTSVDDADYALAAGGSWHLHRTGRRTYVIGRLPGNRKKVYLHRLLLGFPEAQVDHEDGNELNNQRYNLRIATHKQNAQGFQRKKLGASSAFRGVSHDKVRNKWVAQIKTPGGNHRLRRFDLEKDAAAMYDEWATELFGVFAQLNFPSR